MSKQPQNQLLTLKILWAALAMAQLMFIFLAKTMAPNPNPPENFETMRLALTSFAVVSIVMSFVMSKFGAKMARASLTKRGVNVESADIATLVQPLMVAHILRWALLESASLNGFLLSLFSNDPTYVMAFAAVSLLGFALTFPSERALRSMVSA
jgi:hypothetical protein